MKGRITYDQINTAVDELNKAFDAKYKLIATPKSGRTESVKKKMAVYKQQENKDSKGKCEVILSGTSRLDFEVIVCSRYVTKETIS